MEANGGDDSDTMDEDDDGDAPKASGSKPQSTGPTKTRKRKLDADEDSDADAPKLTPAQKGAATRARNKAAREAAGEAAAAPKSKKPRVKAKGTGRDSDAGKEPALEGSSRAQAGADVKGKGKDKAGPSAPKVPKVRKPKSSATEAARTDAQPMDVDAPGPSGAHGDSAQPGANKRKRDADASEKTLKKRRTPKDTVKGVNNADKATVPQRGSSAAAGGDAPMAGPEARPANDAGGVEQLRVGAESEPNVQVPPPQALPAPAPAPAVTGQAAGGDAPMDGPRGDKECLAQDASPAAPSAPLRGQNTPQPAAAPGQTPSTAPTDVELRESMIPECGAAGTDDLSALASGMSGLNTSAGS